MINKTSFVYSNVATGFRAPNIDDMGKIFDSQPDRVIVPNEKLQPEYSYTAEIGAHMKVVQANGNLAKWLLYHYRQCDNPCRITR